MNFFKSTRRASRPGTARYARDLAEYVRSTDGDIAGLTDRTLIEAALRSRAACGLRRVAALLLAISLVAFLLAVGVPDRNSDGCVDFADIALGVRLAFAASAMPARVDGRR
jgi:hypothetical protein